MESSALDIVTTVLDFTAIVIMFYCLYLVLALRSAVPHDRVGSHWNMLSVLVVLFTAGFLTAPFFDQLPPYVLKLVIAVIFVLGAIYVAMTIRMIYGIIQRMTQ